MASNLMNDLPKKSIKVNVYWDYENCPCPLHLPVGALIKQMRESLVQVFKAYECHFNWRVYICETSKGMLDRKQRIALDESYVTLIEVPTKGKKEAADKRIIADIGLRALDLSLADQTGGFVMITGDADFAYILGGLRGRKPVAETALITKQSNVRKALIDSVDPSDCIRMFPENPAFFSNAKSPVGHYKPNYHRPHPGHPHRSSKTVYNGSKFGNVSHLKTAKFHRGSPHKQMITHKHGHTHHQAKSHFYHRRGPPIPRKMGPQRSKSSSGARMDGAAGPQRRINESVSEWVLVEGK